ncbi:MAG: hypothetical protein ACI4L7_00175 [Christensenellales bacterium]
MENEDIFLKKLVKLSKDNVIARECLTSNTSNKKKRRLGSKSCI